MKKNYLIHVGVLLIVMAFSLILITMPVKATEPLQNAYQTPTPNSDGQIIYTVKEGDNCFSIYLLFQNQVPIERIIELNGLDAECSIFPSQQLIIAEVEPATATPPGPQPTATLGEPTPTPFEGNARVCVVLFEDLDGNQMRSETEFYLEGGVVSMSNRSGTFSETLETVGGDPDLAEEVCFEDVPAGQYNLSMGIPDGYVQTTSLNIALEVTLGDTFVIDFAAQPDSQVAQPQETQGETGGRSPILLAIGIILLAGGAGLAFFFIRLRTKAS
jgi:hypothetical protein